jgi:glycerophosphoryl diester phosphodiesterase
MTIGIATHILNIAHRGARAYAPENTLVAFAKAKAMGCDMFEMDVQLSKDGEVVVFHDEQLLRCTDAKTRFPGRNSYYLADFTYKEISQLDAGSWYAEQLAVPSAERQPFLQGLSDAEIAEFVSPLQQKHYASGEIKVSTLVETLGLAKELGLMVNIELKSQPDGAKGLVDAVLKDLKTMKIDNQILVSSFEHDMLKEVRRHHKNIATAILTDTTIKAPIRYLRQYKTNAYNLGCFKGYDDYGFGSLLGKRYLAHIDKIRKSGFKVNIWTCNDKEEMAYLLATGVTGIISDYPNRVSEAIQQFANNAA